MVRRTGSTNTTPTLGQSLIVVGFIPFDDGLWLRSPGALIITPFDGAYTRSLSEAFAELEDLPTPIALEALIAGVQHFDDLGLTEEVPASKVPPDLLVTPGEPLVSGFRAPRTGKHSGGRTAATKKKKKRRR
jgi:hypothetical protein